MKIVAQPIDAMVYFAEKGIPRPFRFRCRELGQEPEAQAVTVGRIFETEQTNIAGAPAIVYRCQSEVEGIAKLYELRYFIRECRWELYKI